MKTMTCRQLAGACDHKFHANTFDEMAEMSKLHSMEMMKKGDSAHMEKMNEMITMMADPEAVEKWFASVQKQFDDLPND